MNDAWFYGALAVEFAVITVGGALEQTFWAWPQIWFGVCGAILSSLFAVGAYRVNKKSRRP